MFVDKANLDNVRHYKAYHLAFTGSLHVSSTTLKYRRPRQSWGPDNAQILIQQRSQTNPTPYKTIATHLNDLETRSPTVTMDRPYSARDCLNKWSTMFPSTMDMYSTIQFMLQLKTQWPGTVCKIEEGDSKMGPVIQAAHIVWPWTYRTMKYLSKTVFCDATFQVTVYKYRVVCLTTLDGNHHHRPLMLSFITANTTTQWNNIFDVFYRCVRDTNIFRFRIWKEAI